MNKGHAKQKPTQALVLIDVINNFEYPDGELLLRRALEIAPRLARLKRRAATAGIPIIYVNDNFGQWHSNAAKLLASCLHTDCRGRAFVEQIQPAGDDYCVLKPMHSAFYQTPLDVILRHLSTSSLIVAGLATNSCILCTAHDANMRDLDVTVVSDCYAARTEQEHRAALANIKEMASARVATSGSIRFGKRR